MTRYGLPRKLAAVLSAVGWLAAFACAALAILMGSREVSPQLLLALLPAAVAGVVGGLVLALAGQVARAVFDIADASAAAGAADAPGQAGAGPGPDDSAPE